MQKRLEVLRFGAVCLSAYRGIIPLWEAVKTSIALNPTVSLRYPILLILDDFFAELSIILNRSRNALDVRASLKVGLQMEQDNFPSH